MSEKHQSTQRFSNRVDDYVKYRPSYPKEVITFFQDELQLKPSHSIADIGSGTGIFTALLLENGNHVIGVEPNAEMRKFAEDAFRDNPKFESVAGTGEVTGLPDGSVDWITVAQAFHWMNPETAKIEFRRILKKGGWVVLLWNDRQTTGSTFLADYEAFLKEFSTDYEKVNHKNTQVGSIFTQFFAPESFREKTFENIQSHDFDGLLGRVTSSSYMPNRDAPVFESMKKSLKGIFDRYQKNGRVALVYDTKLYYSSWK